jgi:hypothetical protein
MKPDPKLIDSMAMRYRHDFGLLDQNQKDSIRTTMKQLWEEVVGLGFYKTEKTNTMNKIERAISDIKSHIKSLDMDILVLETERKSLDRDILVLETEREAFKKQLDTLEKIQDDRSIPHDETIPNIPTWDKSHLGGFSLSSEPDEVPYGSICFCNPTNGGSGICGCIMGNKMVPNPKKYGTGIRLTTNTTTDTNIGMPNGNISTTDSK